MPRPTPAHSEPSFLKSALLAIVTLQALFVSAEGRSPTSPAAHADAQIAYGYNAAKGQFPWVVSLRKVSDNAHFCTGTLIKTNVVLTAAHCFDDDPIPINPRLFKLEIGCVKPDSNFLDAIVGFFVGGLCETRYASKVIIHEKWNKNDLGSGNDVALMILTQPSSKPTVQLGSKNPAVGESVVATGWGSTDKTPGASSSYLKFTKLKVEAGPQFLISTVASESTVCPGDSGGPLVNSAGQVVGVTSYGADVSCGLMSYAVFNSVPYYGSWISGKLQPKPNPPTTAPTPSSSAVLGSGGTFRVSTGSVALTHDAKGCSNKVWMDTIAGGTDQRWTLTAAKFGSETAYYVGTVGCSGGLYLTADNCDLVVDDSDSSVPDDKPDYDDDADEEEEEEEEEEVEDARPAPRPVVPAPRPVASAPRPPARDYDEEEEDYEEEDYDDGRRRRLTATIPGCSTVSLTPGRSGATSQMWLLEGSGSKFTLRSLQLKQGRYDASYLSAAAVRGDKPDIVPRSGTVFTLTK